MSLKELHKQLKIINKKQKENYKHYKYNNGDFYIGYETLKIKPGKDKRTAITRANEYNIDFFLNEDQVVLDIGSNAGFMSFIYAEQVKKIIGVEINPYLVDQANLIKHYFDIKNVEFEHSSFEDISFSEDFDIVFSFANHDTSDKRTKFTFEQYITKIYNLIKKDGYLFFETHHLNANDRDFNFKSEILSEFFNIKRIIPIREGTNKIKRLLLICKKRGIKK